MKRILEILAQRAGTDFSNYKAATIERRLKKRLRLLSMSTIDEYAEYLENNPEEAEEMFKVILIGVTRFFRDPEAFSLLEKYLDEIINLKKNGDDLRVWVPACSTGEEAFSIAILINKLLVNCKKQLRIQIFASDIDEHALHKARKGVYTEAALEFVPEDIRDEYFVKNGDTYEVTKDVRKTVLFSRHDLTQNPPLLRLDLVSCRNLFIYFTAALQKQLLSLFHFALNDRSLLFLGKSETVNVKENLFKPLNTDHKIFSKKEVKGQKPVFTFSGFKKPLKYNPYQKQLQTQKDAFTDVDKALLRIFNHPYAIITETGTLRKINGDIKPYLSLPQGDLKPDFLKMLHEDLRSEIHPLFLKVVRSGAIETGRLRKIEYFGKEYRVKPVLAATHVDQEGEDLFIAVFQEVYLDDIPVDNVPNGDD